MSDVKQKSEAELLFTNLDKPSLVGLSYALRHPDVWPKGFVWNYGNCHQCAMGLAHKLWSEVEVADPDTGATIMARTFSMPYSVSRGIFLGQGPYADWMPTKKETTGHFFNKKTTTRDDHDEVTPEMVADQIDAFLAQPE